MKKNLFLLILPFLFFSCKIIEESPRDSEIYRSTPKITVQTKVISAKDAPIESKFSTGLFLLSGVPHSRTETVYYFYAKDGTSIKVDRATYHQYQVNDEFTGKWK